MICCDGNPGYGRRGRSTSMGSLCMVVARRRLKARLTLPSEGCTLCSHSVHRAARKPVAGSLSEYRSETRFAHLSL